MKRFLWIGVLLFLLVVVWAGAQEKVEPVRPVEPIPEKGKVIDKPQLKPTAKVDPMAESKKTLDKSELKSMTPVSGLQEVSPQYQSLALKEVSPVQGLDGISYKVKEFNDFRGGLDLVSAKTKVAPNSAIELENALWNPQGEMYKRPGYSEHSTPPEVLNFLYRYYQMDGDKWTMGGSDTALYFWHEDSSDWTHLIGTEGTEGRWDGTTFEDMFVGTHEGIVPVVWNGSTFVTMGTSLDSFQVLDYTNINEQCNGLCSTTIWLNSEQTGWDVNEWENYVFEFQVRQQPYSGAGSYDTLTKYGIVLSNTANTLRIRYHTYLGGYILTGWPNYDEKYYGKLFSWFGIDSVWREGRFDEAVLDTAATGYFTKVRDSSFYWDSTLAYKDYIFEVTSGTGEGIKIYLDNYGYIQQLYTDGWDTSGFIISPYKADNFDTTTTYRIYAPAFIGKGSKFCETFDGSLWLGWTGIGEEQDKNIVVWSGTDDLGNWPSGNYIIIESDDGDYITGMAKFPGEYTDVPRQEMIVTKNNSLYKIVPSGTGYDFWLIQSGVGCVSNSAISPAEGILLFPDQHGVWGYDKRKPVSISQKIDPVFEAWDTENLEDVSAVYNPQDRHYYLSLPVEIDTVINGDFITTFYRDSSGTDNQFVHLITTLGGEQNGDIEVTDDTASQYCDIASDTLGNYCVLVNKTLNLYLFRFDSLNARVGATIKINDVSNKVPSGESHVDMNNNGRIVVVWEDFRNDEIFGVYDIYGQCLRFDDGKVGANFAVNSNYDINENKAMQASVAINDDSICIFAWQDWDDPTGFQTCIFVAIDTFPITTVANDYFKPFGGWKNPNGVCELVQEGPQGACANSWWFPDVDAGDTTFVIVCTDDPMESYGRYIVMNYSLDTLNGGITGQVEMNGSDHHSVSMNKKGRFVITWHHLKGLGDDEVYAIEYDIGGVFVDSYFRVDNAASGISTMYPAVAINEEDQYCIVWWDERCDFADYYRCYTWEGEAVSGEALLNDICDLPNTYYYPEITATNIWLEIDTTKYTLAWNIDHHGWSKESFSASAYCYQHSIFDEVKILFADPGDTFVYNYATQADDIEDPVILTYQTPYFNFGQYPSFDYEMRFATVEAFLDTGNIYLTWYKNYGDSIYYDSLICGSDCRQEMILPADSLWGWNISMKLRTGSDIDDFTLSRFWWEYTEDQNRK